MKAGKGVGPPRNSRPNRVNRLKDEVYRQMFKLEEGKPGAEMGLSLALLRAWAATDTEPEGSDEWDWLKKISPICLQMIERSLQRLDAMRSCLPR
jgi:hypothetical protein